MIQEEHVLLVRTKRFQSIERSIGTEDNSSYRIAIVSQLVHHRYRIAIVGQLIHSLYRFRVKEKRSPIQRELKKWLFINRTKLLHILGIPNPTYFTKHSINL